MITQYRFKSSVMAKIKSDGVLMLKMSNAIGGNITGLLKSFDRDSQTLMHIAVLNIVASKLSMEVSDLYEKVKK